MGPGAGERGLNTGAAFMKNSRASFGRHPCYSLAMKGRDRLIAWAPMTSVALMLVAIYSSWAVAYAQLGRKPLPSSDDPRSIGGLSTDWYNFCLAFVFALLAVWFVTSILACVAADSPKSEQRSRWLVGITASLMVVGPFLLLFLMFTSPGNAIGWFVD
jgi:hypothetical protein